MSDQILRSLAECINAERLRAHDETRDIHRRWLQELQLRPDARLAEELEWADAAAGVARLRAMQSAAQVNPTGAGDALLDETSRITPAAVVGEIVWRGLSGWFSEDVLFEQLMNGSSVDLRSSRAILLNPAFRHIAMASAQAALTNIVIVLYASEQEAGLPAGMTSVLLAKPGRRAAVTTGPPPAALPVDVFPLWEPVPTRWRLTLTRENVPVRAQIAAQLGVRSELLHGLPRGEKNPDLFLTDASSPRIPDGWQVAISLAEIDPELVAFSIPSASAISPGGAAHDAPGFTDAMKQALGLLTPVEESLSAVAVEAGGGFLTQPRPEPERSFPERPPGAPEQRVFVHGCVDVGASDPAALQSALAEMQSNGARVFEVGVTSSYALAQELFVTWDADDPETHELAASELVRIGNALAEERGAAASAGTPVVYPRPYRGDDGYRDAILDDMKRMYWLHSPVIGSQFAEALRRATVASFRRFDTSPRQERPDDTLTFSQSTVAAFIAEEDLLAAELYWAGLDSCVSGVFQEMHVSDATCHQDALEILTRCGLLWIGDRGSNDFDPVDDVQRAARTALSPAAMRMLSRLAQQPLYDLRRRGEPVILAELLRWQTAPNEIGGAVPGLLGAAREAYWRSLSMLRRELAALYRRHLAGDEGRNVASFISVCELLDAHLRGPRSPHHGRLPDGSRIAQSLDRAESALRIRLANKFAPLDRRYRHWFRRLLRWLLRNGKSPLPRDLAVPLEEFFNDVVALFTIDSFRQSLATADAMPRPIVEQLSRLSEATREYAAAERKKHERLLAALTAGPTVFLSDHTRTLENAQTMARAQARRLWNRHVSDLGARGWMIVGQSVLTSNGRPENPFAPRPGAVFGRLVMEVGHAATKLTNGLPVPATDHAAVIQSKARQMLRPSGIDQTQLAVTVPITMDSDVLSRTWWHVIAGLPHQAYRGRVDEIRRRLGELQNICYADMTWIEAPAMTGVFIFQDIHGLSRSCMQP